MFLPKNTYELLDFGAGRKLERIAGVIVDRPCPAAEGFSKKQPTLWREATTRFAANGHKGWQHLQTLPHAWEFTFSEISLLLRPTPFGHIGVFPEQMVNWEWFSTLAIDPAKTKRCLNLFAYTGASSLVLAQAGWHVTHVDASRPTLLWARENSAHSGLDAAPIRWIQEDARRFVEREIRRGNQYDLILLDPPSYGHGPKGEAWDFEHDMPELLASVFELISDSSVGVLWTGHSDSDLIKPLIQSVSASAKKANLIAQRLERSTLNDLATRDLDCGYRMRWLKA